MPVINIAETGIAGEVRGRISSPAVFRDIDLAGIWQVRTRSGRKTQVKMAFYTPFNPQTEAQQAWRAIFAAGVSAWQALTESAKNIYRTRAEYLPLTGFNLYLREHLLSQ